VKRMWTALRRRIPVPLKRGYRASRRRLAHPRLSLVARRRRSELRRALQEFRARDEGAPIPEDLLRRLFHGWGNERYAARPEYLRAVIDAADRARGPILECGCGLSTLLLGIEGSRRGVAVCALEHDAYWAKRTRRELAQNEIENAVVVDAPLCDYGDFVWYEIPRALPASFSLVVCDGPPADRGGRYGLVPLLADRIEGAEILLDDATRSQEEEIISRWTREYGIISKLDGTFARLST
jgi:hypothetical protein